MATPESKKSAWVFNKIEDLDLENPPLKDEPSNVDKGLTALLTATKENFLTILSDHKAALLGDEATLASDDFFANDSSYDDLMQLITKKWLVMKLNGYNEQELELFLKQENKKEALSTIMRSANISEPLVVARISDELVNEISRLMETRVQRMADDLPVPRPRVDKPPAPAVEMTGAELPPTTQELPPPRPSMLLWMEQKGVLGFVDEKVNVDSSEQPKAAAQVVNNSLEQSLPQETHYLGVKITEGEVIRSKGELPSGLRGVLEQDHTGKVVDKTAYAMDRTDPNAEESMSNDKSVIALKAAKMLLDNYKSDSGPVVIRGRDPQMAAKMYAAVLFLTKDNPLFKNLKIDSTVAGFEPPGRFTSDRSFIKKQLGLLAGSSTAASIKKQVAELRQGANDVGEYGVPSPNTRREIIEDSTYSPHTNNKP